MYKRQAQRELATGFYYGVPTENEQLFGKPRAIPQYAFAARVISYDASTQLATLEQRNHFRRGEEVEFFGPGFVRFSQRIEELYDESGKRLETANQAMMTVRVKVERLVATDFIMRKRKAGVVNTAEPSHV